MFISLKSRSIWNQLLFKRAVRSQQPSLFFPQGPYLLHDVGLGYQRVFIAYWKNSICNLLSPLSARPLFLLCCFLITSWQVEWSRIHVGNLILQKDNYEKNAAFPTTSQCCQLLLKWMEEHQLKFKIKYK